METWGLLTYVISSFYWLHYFHFIEKRLWVVLGEMIHIVHIVWLVFPIFSILLPMLAWSKLFLTCITWITIPVCLVIFKAILFPLIPKSFTISSKTQILWNQILRVLGVKCNWLVFAEVSGWCCVNGPHIYNPFFLSLVKDTQTSL